MTATVTIGPFPAYPDGRVPFMAAMGECYSQYRMRKIVLHIMCTSTEPYFEVGFTNDVETSNVWRTHDFQHPDGSGTGIIQAVCPTFVEGQNYEPVWHPVPDNTRKCPAPNSPGMSRWAVVKAYNGSQQDGVMFFVDVEYVVEFRGESQRYRESAGVMVLPESVEGSGSATDVSVPADG